jgi:hypothetical protein
MTIRLYLPDSLSRIARGKTCHEVKGQTLGECLNNLVAQLPAIKNALFYDTGGLLPYIKLLVDDGGADVEGLTRRVKDGAQIFVKTNAH